MPSLGGGFYGSQAPPQFANDPIIAVITSPSLTLCVTELEFIFGGGGGTAVAVGMNVQSAASLNSTLQINASQDFIIEDGSADLLSAITFISGFNTALTAPTKFFRRAVLNPTTSNAFPVKWTFPRGLIIQPSNAMVFWVTTQSGNQVNMGQFLLNLRCDG